MAIIREVRGFSPKYGENCFFAENAAILGNVSMGDNCSVWYSAVLRGDVHYIKMGNNVNVQDGAVIHATFEKSPTNIGSNVSIAHNAVVHGCTIQDNVLIGMGAIVLDDAVIESNCIIAAGSVVTKGTIVKSGSVMGGCPAKLIKELSPELLKGDIHRIANNYSMYSSWFQEK